MIIPLGFFKESIPINSALYQDKSAFVANTNTGATSVALTLPTIIDDDFIFVAVMTAGSSTFATPTGFTDLVEWDRAGGGMSYAAFYKIGTAIGDSGSALTVPVDNGLGVNGACAYTFRGVNTSTPYEILTSTGEAVNSVGETMQLAATLGVDRLGVVINIIEDNIVQVNNSTGFTEISKDVSSIGSDMQLILDTQTVATSGGQTGTSEKTGAGVDYNAQVGFYLIPN